MFKMTAPLIIIFLTAIFLFLAATNIQGGWLYLVDALLWSVVLMAFVLPFLQLRKLHCQRRFAATVYAGQSTAVTLEARASGRVPLMFMNLEDLPPFGWRAQKTVELPAQKSFILSLAPGETFAHSYELTPEQAGIYTFGHLRTGSFGPLGLLGLYRRQKLTNALLVLPNPPEHVLPLFSAEQQQALQQARYHSHHSEDISHFREYQPGDSKRQIHWKNSARQQKLIVAEAREEPFQKALVLVDMSQSQSHSSFLKVVSTAEQVCHALLAQNLELVCWAQPAQDKVWAELGLSPPQRHVQNVRSWEQIAYWLASLMPDAPESLSAAMTHQGFQPNSQLLLVISAEPEPALMQRLMQARGPSLAPILLFTEPASDSGALASQIAVRPLSAAS